MLADAVEDVLAICRAELGTPGAAELVERARAAVAAAVTLNADVLGAMPADPRQRLHDIQMWQFLWFELAAAAPHLFPGFRDEDQAMELAVRYALTAERDCLQALMLTAVERAQLSGARETLCAWTGLWQLASPPQALVVSQDCLALRRVLRSGQALRAPDLRGHTLIAAEPLARMRERDGEVKELVLALLHEELHVALSVACDRPTGDGWVPLAHAAEEALVSALELAAEWWLWTNERPSRDDILERATYHGYREVICGLVSALAVSDDELLAALARVAVAVASDGTDAGVVAVLNQACATDFALEDWLSALPMP